VPFFYGGKMIIQTLADAIGFINTLYEGDSTPPTSGDEDYTVWTSLLNIANGVWENEEGVLWRELFVKLEDADDGDKVTESGETSYDCPTDFVFPLGFVRVDGLFYEVKKPTQISPLANDKGKWCYFTGNPSVGYDLNFNPNLSFDDDQVIEYEYYKQADDLSSPTDKFEMSDPMFAVYFVLAEIKKDEGDVTAGAIATQKLEAMKTKNEMGAEYQTNSVLNEFDDGFGT
jgi:hypothetical protein